MLLRVRLVLLTFACAVRLKATEWKSDGFTEFMGSLSRPFHLHENCEELEANQPVLHILFPPPGRPYYFLSSPKPYPQLQALGKTEDGVALPLTGSFETRMFPISQPRLMIIVEIDVCTKSAPVHDYDMHHFALSEMIQLNGLGVGMPVADLRSESESSGSLPGHENSGYYLALGIDEGHHMLQLNVPLISRSTNRSFEVSASIGFQSIDVDSPTIRTMHGSVIGVNLGHDASIAIVRQRVLLPVACHVVCRTQPVVCAL